MGQATAFDWHVLVRMDRVCLRGNPRRKLDVLLYSSLSATNLARLQRCRLWASFVDKTALECHPLGT